MEKTTLDKMVDRFLCWKLPKDFGPDSGISFAPTYFQQGENADLHWPTGTNLLTAVQAKEMFSHCIAGALADIEEDAYVIHQLGKLLAEIAVIVNGPEPPMTRWSYHDLPEKVLALKDAAGRKAVGAVFEKLPQSQTPKSTGRFG